jgi:hypothetical protein
MSSAIPGEVLWLLFQWALLGAVAVTALLAVGSIFFTNRKARRLPGALLGVLLLVVLGAWFAWPVDRLAATRALDAPAQAQVAALQAELAARQAAQAETAARLAEMRDTLEKNRTSIREGETAITDLKIQRELVVRESSDLLHQILEFQRMLEAPPKDGPFLR